MQVGPLPGIQSAMPIRILRPSPPKTIRDNRFLKLVVAVFVLLRVSKFNMQRIAYKLLSALFINFLTSSTSSFSDGIYNSYLLVNI